MPTYAKLFKLPPLRKTWGIIKDNAKRQAFAETELEQLALKNIARNTLLPTKVRMQAQLQLASMPNYTKISQIRNRCLLTGSGRAVVGQVGLNRNKFRDMVLRGEIPGFTGGNW